MIESPANPRIAAAVRLIKRGERVLLEGERRLSDALDAGLLPEIVFFDPVLGSAPLERARAAGAVLIPASPGALRRMSDLVTARGLVALAPVPERRLADLPAFEKGLALILDGVQDPTNVGAILRSAEAFGVSAALLTEGCASPFSSKALRASASSALRMPLAMSVTAEEALSWLRAHGGLLMGADAHTGQSPDALSLRKDGLAALVIGSEGRGISDQLERALNLRVRIPLAGRVESLNAAVAASILLYEIAGRARP